MTDAKRISEDVLQVLKNECKNDKIMEMFLTELIFEESEHSGVWWWKKKYNKCIGKYQSEWRDNFR